MTVVSSAPIINVPTQLNSTQLTPPLFSGATNIVTKQIIPIDSVIASLYTILVSDQGR